MSSLIIDPLAVTPTPPADPFSLLDPVKEEAKRRERADRIEAAVLNGVDSLMTPEQKASREELDAMSPDKGAASRQRMTHSMFLAGETGRPVQEIDEAYDYWKTLYARQYFEGVNAADEGAFGAKVKELVTKRRDFRVQTEAVYESGVRDALTLEPEDFMKRASRLTDIYGSDTKLGPAEGQKLRETYLLARQQAEGKLAPLRPRAQQIWNELMKGTIEVGKTLRFLANEEQEEYDPMERIVTLLEDTPDNERPMLLQLLKSQAGDKVDDPFTMGAVRGFTNMMAGAADQMDIRRIGGYLNDLSAAEPKVDAILNTPEKIMARMASGMSLITPGELEAPRTRTLSPDEVQTLRAVFDRQVKRYDLASEARTIFEQNVQPIDMSGFAAELRSDVGGSIGAMAPMTLPLAGVVIAQSGYANEDYLLLRKQGADFATAKGQSELRGGLKSGIERVSFLFNFVPTSAFGKLSTMMLNGGGSPALVAGARGMAFGIGKRVTLTQGVEYTEEIAQAAVPLFTAAIAEPLGLDLPQQAQLSAELERFQAEGGLWRPRVYAAVAAMTLLPAGVRGVADTKQAREEVIAKLADPDYATAMGIKPNSAVIIATMLPEDRLDAYLESFPARDTSTPAAKEAAESVARKEQEQGQWEQDQVTKAEAAGVRVRRTDAGTYEVQDLISGTTLSMATAGEAATTMRHVMLERGLLEEERFLKAADKHIEMMRRGRSIDVTNIETDLLKELEQATADQRDNDVVTIWERADQYRLSIGKEALDRDRLNPDSRNALAGMTVYGHSITSVREGVARSISKVMSGGDSLDLLEEQAENDYREAVHYGQVTKETMKAIIKKLETATGDQYQFVDSDLGVAEAWSRIVRLYATGTQNSKGNAITQGARGDVAQNMRDRRNALRQAEAAIAGGPTGKKASDLVEKRRRLREAEANGVTPGAFTKLREYYDQAKAQLGQVARLMKARDAGQLDDLETMIRQSVGLTEQDTYDSQLTKQMEATEATINPPDSWTSSMSVGSRAQPEDASNRTIMPDGAELIGPTSFSVRAYQGTPADFKKETKYRLPSGEERWLIDGEDQVPAGAVVIDRAPLGRQRLDKIGSGQGLQLYGWGLYQSEAPGVAKEFQVGLARNIIVDGEVIMQNNRRVGSTGDKILDDLLINNRGNIDAAIADATEQGDVEYLPQLESLRGRVDTGASGNLYTVDLLPDEEDFMHWDKPLSEQSEKVKAVLNSFMPSAMSDPMYMGSNAYLAMRSQFGGAEQASRALAKAGIPGMRYANNRVSKTGSSNYVIFDENLVKILEKNGQPAPAVTQEGSYSIGPKAISKAAAKVVAKVQDSLTTDFPANEKFPSRIRPQSQDKNSMLTPPRLNLLDHPFVMPAGVKFASLDQFIQRINTEVGRMAEFAERDPEKAAGSLGFYSGMGNAAYDLASGGLAKADLYLRWFAYLSPRSTVISNAAKAIGGGVSGVTSGFTPGLKAGTFKQIFGMQKINEQWMNNQSFGMDMKGVDNKVRNFYLNGAAELLERAVREQAPDAQIIELAQKLVASLETSSKTRGGVIVKFKTMADLPKLRTELQRLVTSDMWDQASLGNVRAGFILATKGSNYKWVVPGAGEVVSLTSAKGQKVLEWHAQYGENAKKKAAKEEETDEETDEEDAGGDGVSSWTDLTWQELESLDYDARAGTIRVFQEKDDGESYLAAKGESPLYDVSQAISGVIADTINAMGGMAGKKRWTAYNVQEFRWGMEKTRNPKKGNRDFSSYDEVVNGIKDLATYLEGGQARLDIKEAMDRGEMPQMTQEMLDRMDSSTDPDVLRSVLEKLGKTKRFVGSLAASEYSYAQQARQLIPFELQSEDGGALYKDIVNEALLRVNGNGRLLLDRMVSPGFVKGLQDVVQAAGLPVMIRTAETGTGSYRATMSPQITLEVSGPRWATKLLNQSIGLGLEQTGANLIRNPTLAEISAGVKLTDVLQIAIPEAATDAQIETLMQDLGQLQDSQGRSSEKFIGGHTSIRDAGGRRVVAIHGGFYDMEFGDGNFGVEVFKVMEQIVSTVDLIFGNEAEADVTARIVDTYGHDPGAKYAPENQPGGEGADESGGKQDRAPGETVAADSIGRQAEQGIRAYVLRRVADASAPERQASDRGVGKDTQDVLADYARHIDAFFAAKSGRASSVAPATVTATGFSNPQKGLVDLSARAIGEGLENPQILGTAALLWDLAQRTQRAGIGDVQIRAEMTPAEMREANTGLVTRVAFKSAQQVIKDTEKNTAKGKPPALPGKGVILQGGGEFAVPEGFEVVPYEGGAVLLLNKERAVADYGDQWQEKAVAAQRKKGVVKVYLETLAPGGTNYGYAVTTTQDGQVSRAEVISEEVGRRLLGEDAAEDSSASSMSVGPRRGAPAVSQSEARITELQAAIDAKYESGKLRGVLDMEDELETLLEQASSNQQGMEADAEEDVDRGSPDAASFLIDALARWNREDAGAYSTFGAFARRLTGDNEYVIDQGATDAEIEEAARDATAEYERRRTAMRNVRMMGITDVVKAIRDGNTDTPLRAVNAVIDDATELRERVRAAAERRAQPRQTGKAAILDQIVRGMKSGKLDAPAGKAIIEFVNGLADATVEGTAVSMRSGKGVSSFDFGESLATLFYNQSNDAAQTAIHEFWHGLSRFLPTDEVDKMRADYQAALAKYLVKHPGFFALVGRYALLPEQFEDYSRMATPAELAQLQGYNARGAKVDNFSPDADHYKIAFTKENYRYVMLDEWIAETMTDRVLDDQPVPEGFMGQMVAIFRKFWSTLKAAMGRDPYERFRQAVMGPDVRQVMWRDTPVEEARALWQSDKVATPFNQRYSSMSIGPRAKLDAVQARLDARLEKDPAARRKVAAEAARRLRKLETDWTTERLTWNGKIDAIDEPRTRKSLDNEQAMRQAQFGKEAADEWRTGIDAKQAKDYSPRASLLRDMRTLDAIVGALPPEIRYQVGGQIKLAGLATDEARADEIARRIDRIAPLLERHLQKEFTASLEKLLERAEAKNAKPGEKMTGTLGPEVQHLMDVVRKAYKLTAAQTEDALAALDSRLADPDITPEQQALAERERELVNLVGGWRPEYTNSGRLDTLGRPIYTRVSEGASAAQMEAAYKAVEETYETGFQEWQAKILAKRLARQAIRDSLMVDTGKTGAAPERDAKALEELGWTAKLKNMFMSLSSFEEMLRYTFGMDSVQAIRLADQEREAAYAYEDAVQAMGDLVHAHFTAIGGDSLAGEKIRYALSQKDKTVGKRTLSEMEIMQAALMWQQKDGQRHMIGKLDESNMPIGTWHYDQAWMDEAMAQLSPEGLSTLAFIRAIYAAEYAPLNAIYRARHGVDLPANANYAPVTVAPAQAKAGEMIDPVGGGTTTGSILTPGSLRTRSRSAIAEPDFKDALQVMLAHTKQMEHWKAYYDFAVEAQAVLGNRELGNAVEARAGAQGKLVLRKWIDVFAQGGTRDAGAALTMNVELGSATGRGARMALVGRVGTLLIQSTQLGAAIAEMPSGDYVYRFGKLMAGQMDWSAAMRSEFIQRRMAQAPPIVQQALAGLSSDNPTVVKHTVQRLGTLISGADALFTAGTYAMILDYQMGEAAKLGLTGPDAEAYAHRAAERSVERVAQPTRAGTRSLYENTATSPAARLGWAFASEARQKVALAAWAAVNRKADRARAARVAMVVWGVGGLMAAILRNAWRDMRDDDDDTWMELAKKVAKGDWKGVRDNVFDDRNWKLSQLVTSTIAGPLTGIPLIGEAMQSAIAVATGGWDSSGNLLSGLGKGVGSAVDLLSGEFLEADEPMEDVMKDAEAVLMMMGLFNENLASASSLAHVVRDGAAVVDGLYDTDKERLMKDAANQSKLEKEQDKAAKNKDLTEEQQEALEEEAKKQRKAKKQAAREEAAAKWRAANP